MSFRYIGSKARLADTIIDYIGSPPSKGRFVDAFCGTGAIAESAAELGWPIWLNDHLISSGVISAARLISVSEVAFDAQGGYTQAVNTLNILDPIKGFIWREYSPASIRFSGIERRYFSERNAGRIDAVRAQISKWKKQGLLTEKEECLLIADLLSAINRIANIAGTFGCFLSRWTQQSTSDLSLIPRELKNRKTDLSITAQDVATLTVGRNDLVYLDPPYTKRQYASYYHIPETVALGDEPKVEGISGLRPWRDKASDYCYKSRALEALSGLIANLNANRILLSYSAEGHVPIDSLHENLEKTGNVTTHALKSVGRYRPNKTASAARSSVREYLIIIDKDFQQEAILSVG